jgi:hypothetical protein
VADALDAMRVHFEPIAESTTLPSDYRPGQIRPLGRWLRGGPDRIAPGMTHLNESNASLPSHMNRYTTLAASIAAIALSTGCSLPVTDFKVISTKDTQMNADPERGKRVSAMDCVPVVLVHWGQPDLNAAISKAIESAGPGYDALIDGAVYRRYEHFIFGRECWEVEGIAVPRPATAAL